MSAVNHTAIRLPAQKPEYLTGLAASRLAGVEKRTLAAHVEPDAVYYGPNGKSWPLWLVSSVQAWTAERAGRAE
jgi:hypothetical protein